MAATEVYEVEEIIDKRRNRGHLEYKVRWKNYKSGDDTWEPVENLRNAMDIVDSFEEKFLQKHGLIQPIRIKIKSLKNKGYGGTLLTLKKPVSPKHASELSPTIDKSKHNSSRMTGPTRLRRISTTAEQNQKLDRLNRQLSYDKYMDKYKQAVRQQRNQLDQVSKMSPQSRTKLMALPLSPSSLSSNGHNFSKKPKPKSSKFKRKRLPDSPENSDAESESTVLYSLDEKLTAGTSSSEPRIRLSNNFKTGNPVKKTKRSHSAAVVEDGIISFPRKRNNSLHMEEGELELTTPQSTPPSTPNGSQTHLEHASHKVPSIMTPMMRLKKLSPTVSKIISPTGSIQTKAFYSPPTKIMPTRTAGSVARRRLSHMSMSSEDEDEPDRRFSMRVTENIFKYKEVVVKKSHGYTQVWLFTNSPSRNAVGVKALQELNSVLENAAKDETKAVVLCGSGSMFCSGLDLRLLAMQTYEERKKTAKALSEAVREFVDTLISFPKLLIAAVNGPAIGFGAAILPLCDIVYASDKAYFHLPYNSIGMTPEGCCSFTYPHYLGLALASEMLYCGRKLTALEACTGGLVSQVLWPTTFMQEVIPRVQCMVTGSLKGLMLTKSLVRSHLRAKLEYTNESECAILKDRWGSSECYKLVKNYVEKGYDQGV